MSKKLSTVEIVNHFIQRNEIEDEDLQQELFLTAFEVKERNQDAMSSQVIGALVRTFKKYTKEQQNKQDPTYIELAYDLDELVNKDLLQEIIPELIEEKCTEREILIIYLRCYRCLSYTQIGDIIGLSAERTRQIYFRALRKFKQPSVSRLIIDFYE